MKDRRFYERIPVDIPCIIYVNEKEYEGKISDMCEGGLSIELKDAIEIIEGQLIGVAYEGSYKKCNIKKTTIIISEFIKILRVSKDRKKLGCQIRLYKGELEKYVEEKKVENYCKEMEKQRKMLKLNFR